MVLKGNMPLVNAKRLHKNTLVEIQSEETGYHLCDPGAAAVMGVCQNLVQWTLSMRVQPKPGRGVQWFHHSEELQESSTFTAKYLKYTQPPHLKLCTVTFRVSPPGH